jgi:hypothetical protein
MKKENIPHVMLDRMQAMLHPGEKLLWVGMPEWNHLPDTMESKSRQMIRGLLAYWLGLAGLAYLASQGLLSPALLVLFVGLIVVAIIGTGIVARISSAQHKVYALTNQRALILSGKRVQSYDASEIEFIERVMHADGTGDIVFRHQLRSQTMLIGYVITQIPLPQSIGFFGIRNPQHIEELMLETFRAQAETRYAALHQPKSDLQPA